MADIKLSSNQEKILYFLRLENKALSAYSLLDKAKTLDLYAPTQVYRILQKLIDKGLVIKLNTLNRYFAYKISNPQQCYVLTICTECKKVQVVAVSPLGLTLEQIMQYQQFVPKNQFVEILGQCFSCRDKQLKNISHIFTES